MNIVKTYYQEMKDIYELYSSKDNLELFLEKLALKNKLMLIKCNISYKKEHKTVYELELLSYPSTNLIQAKIDIIEYIEKERFMSNINQKENVA